MTESTMPGLLPCPFCGGSRIKAHYIRDGRSIGCADCGATLHAFNGPYDITTRLIALWNRRALPADPPAEWIEAMARAIYEDDPDSDYYPEDVNTEWGCTVYWSASRWEMWRNRARVAYAALVRQMEGRPSCPTTR